MCVFTHMEDYSTGHIITIIFSFFLVFIFIRLFLTWFVFDVDDAELEEDREDEEANETLDKFRVYILPDIFIMFLIIVFIFSPFLFANILLHVHEYKWLPQKRVCVRVWLICRFNAYIYTTANLHTYIYVCVSAIILRLLQINCM